MRNPKDVACGEKKERKYTRKLGKSSPTALAIGEDEVDELLVFFNSPWPFLQAYFVTTWLPPHLSPLSLYIFFFLYIV